MKRLDGKVAVITGGSSGIGLAHRAALREGRRLRLHHRATTDGARQGRQAHRGQRHRCRQRRDHLKDIDRLYEVVKAKKGHVDIVFANAGYGDLSPLGSITPEAYESSFNLNVRGVLFVVQAALPLFRDGGSIIISGAIAGAKGIPGFTVYGAAKATLRSFARTWTQELKERRIRTNILSPGPVLTPSTATVPKGAIDQIVAGVPLGRIASPEEIANVALFLASDEASYVTGVELFADGGTPQV